MAAAAAQEPGKETPKELQTDTLSPYDQKQSDLGERTLVCVPKAYKNESFLMSREGRTIRIICEFEETLKRLRDNGVEGTFLFFGSARAMYRADWEQEVKFAKQKLCAAADAKTRADMEAKLLRLRKTEWLCEYMDKAEALSRRLTQWAMSDEIISIRGQAPAGGHALRQANLPYLTEGETPPAAVQKRQQFVVSTGGGPGLMEAANRGAASVRGARNAGFAISLPFEAGLNPFVTPELAFTYHYFFTRKYWMLYPCKALIACPGGFGTFDELFESVTLKQTGKKPPFPIVLIGKQYWKEAINWQMIADKGVISQAEVDSMLFTDDIDEAFRHITQSIISNIPKSPTGRPAEAPKRPADAAALPAAKRSALDTPGSTPSPPGSPSARPQMPGAASVKALQRAMSPLSRPADW
eukprot:TRINITY_DN70095_c0_g1_i1.p1 TRINITY_DN70095_c0_g1~~TRINITY_DN70095_c0_g1_i1.p1  ORF type:complete len:438 (+),score=178.01 TRINITY_DN70095_c0_g1_i1:81-1316(+)